MPALRFISMSCWPGRLDRRSVRGEFRMLGIYGRGTCDMKVASPPRSSPPRRSSTSIGFSGAIEISGTADRKPVVSAASPTRRDSRRAVCSTSSFEPLSKSRLPWPSRRLVGRD